MPSSRSPAQSQPKDPKILSDEVVRLGAERHRMEEYLRLVAVIGGDG